jgi:TAT-translocated FGD2 family F420-dependent dehydrogenase
MTDTAVSSTRAAGRRIGFVLAHEQFGAPELLELGAAAEQAGFEAVWASDHFHPWQDNQGHGGQAWITLAALGQRTSAIALGSGVTCPLFRYRPAVVAQAFASLGVLYPNRVFLGLGSGEALNEVPPGGGWADAGERVDRLDEALRLIRRLWGGDWVDFDGSFYSVRGCRIYDLPAERVPIYVAASGRRTLQLAAELADGWITDATSLGDAELRDAFRQGLRAADKQDRSSRVLIESYVVVGGQAEAREAATYWRFVPIGLKELLDEPDPRAIQHAAEQRLSVEQVYERWIVSQDPAAHIQGIQRLLDQGATDVFIHSGQADQRRVIEFYGSHVLPRLRLAP